ncbi:MAG: hypothetical protein KDC76_09010 [Bacteroidetes bacterium]|nr:hypothetical protein [Bacteroidota bacterium]
MAIVILFVGCTRVSVNRHVDVYGHGGGGFMSATNPHPANSEAAIRRALFAFGADGVEVDIQLTSDGKIVLYHDHRLESSTNGFGAIGELNVDDVVTASYKGALDASRDYPVISLQHLFDILDDAQRVVKVSLNLQPQSDALDQPALFQKRAEQLMAEITSDVTSRHVIIIESPEPEQMIALKMAAAGRDDIPLYFTAEATDQNIAFAVDHQLQGLVSNYLKCTPQMRQRMDNANLQWSLYGLKIHSDVREALNFQPDAVQTDDIPFTLRMLDR